MTDTTTAAAPPPDESPEYATGAPLRTCYGCGQTDNHPRIHDIPDNGGQGPEYHIDCAPRGLLERQGIGPDHPALVATAAGKRGVQVIRAMHEAGHITDEAMQKAGLIEGAQS
jgi:hypothetical protein